MIISVDHGNKSIKTPNALFTSGLISSEGLQGFKTDYICWNGRYYTLTEQRISYLRDKTEDERFYVLTLFAIAKELERRKAAETLDPIDITLLIGLPPAHYEQLHSRFEQYFLRRREAIDFEYNGKYYSIRISKVLSYPQAFAAAVTQYSTLKTYSVAYIIDIGGFTIDVLKLRNGRPDLAVVESFEKGVITLYNSITSKCNALYARILEDCDRVNGVVVVVDGDETNTVLRKGEVGVKPGQRGVAAQSGKVFGDRHGHPSRLDFGQHGLKAGTVIGHTAYTVIHEKGWVGEVMLPGILQKHGLLRRDLSRLFSPAEYKCPTLL